jgi:hypothetical protein
MIYWATFFQDDNKGFFAMIYIPLPFFNYCVTVNFELYLIICLIKKLTYII